ncbi:hypothetical protein T07_4512 [Trichinella nelsoni]|uniref:Uncharacterized protein n=1 Tax=Trichinella nelsoni TaxID=6336 RepID=A0A0V0SAC4_9BILA|nr:hypothetical protein T07_4512 [Trichinella nelsoni]
MNKQHTKQYSVILALYVHKMVILNKYFWEKLKFHPLIARKMQMRKEVFLNINHRLGKISYVNEFKVKINLTNAVLSRQYYCKEAEELHLVPILLCNVMRARFIQEKDLSNS